MSYGKLPDKHQLIKWRVAGLTHKEIAEKYGVSRQAVTNKLDKEMSIPLASVDIAELLPWPFAEAPKKRDFLRQHVYKGLRGLLAYRNGRPTTKEDFAARRTLINHLLLGEVVTFRIDEGFSYVPRKDSTGLVIAWPADEEGPSPQVQRYLRWDPEEASAIVNPDGPLSFKG
ncbi:hypothetical protein OG897_08550 [Streptomyces sp. NBC_00237]|uniref:hypothetical protein n=1 Tax=Streptomyces sp. NBC_00237 TaxID=2975687 RepID=UPI00225B711C|nr:hypothetical protein [Streptomyces sp. NBC_00237]MCX5201499.1 hypothetical protein [Streptomyces sp. NBC_00237]